MEMIFNYKNIFIPSLQGTLAKHTSPPLHPNFAKEPFRPSRSNVELRDNANMIDKLIENKNRQCLTMHKNNSRNSGKLKGCSSFKLYRKLKDLSSVIGYYSYADR